MRRCLILSSVLLLAARAMIALTTSKIVVLVVLFTLVPLGISLSSPAMMTGLRRYTSASNRSFAFSVFYAVMNLAALVSGLVVDAVRELVSSSSAGESACSGDDAPLAPGAGAGAGAAGGGGSGAGGGASSTAGSATTTGSGGATAGSGAAGMAPKPTLSTTAGGVIATTIGPYRMILLAGAGPRFFVVCLSVDNAAHAHARGVSRETRFVDLVPMRTRSKRMRRFPLVFRKPGIARSRANQPRRWCRW